MAKKKKAAKKKATAKKSTAKKKSGAKKKTAKKKSAGKKAKAFYPYDSRSCCGHRSQRQLYPRPYHARNQLKP